jgi:hypothetical protein
MSTPGEGQWLVGSRKDNLGLPPLPSDVVALQSINANNDPGLVTLRSDGCCTLR